MARIMTLRQLSEFMESAEIEFLHTLGLTVSGAQTE